MDFVNIIGTLFDNSIEHIVALAHQIKDLRLNKNQQDINEEVERRLESIEQGKDKFKHQLITQAKYDALTSYEKNTIYLIIDFSEETSVFGDTFPFILGGPSSKFGDNFPLIFN